MKNWYDTEFVDDGEKIELLSIGIVAEDGREYYAVVRDLDLMKRAWNTKSGEQYWLRNNVMNSLPVYDTPDYGLLWDSQHDDWKNIRTREEIAREITTFLRAGGEIEYWAWYAAYDHVALSQLFGRMLDLPSGFPMYTNDLKQEHVRLGSPRIPEQAQGAHNALEDARWNKSTYQYLKALDGPVKPHIEPLEYRGWTTQAANPKRTRIW